MKRRRRTRDPEVFARLLRRATRVANHDVHAMARNASPACKGMGTTVSAAGDRRRSSSIVATVGDSRAYVLRAGEIVQVTRDQSLSSALLAAGHDADDGASAQARAILQALGVGDDVEPSLSIIELRRGDRVLLCSDGLHGLVGDPALALLMSAPHTRRGGGAGCSSPRRARRAARDNITAVVADVGGDACAARRATTTCRRFASSIRRRKAIPR